MRSYDLLWSCSLLSGSNQLIFEGQGLYHFKPFLYTGLMEYIIKNNVKYPEVLPIESDHPLLLKRKKTLM